ncbi:MAG: hypothetical protein ACREOY_05160 [Candidatus Dormibacteraceae bacterium]
MATYLEVLFRHRLRFASLTLIPIAIAAGVMVAFTGYRASTTLSVADPASFGATFVPIGWSQSQTPAQNIADGIAQVVKTPAFVLSLSDALTSSGAASGSADAQQTARSLANNLKIGVSGSQLVTMSYSCQSASLCVSVLSAAVPVVRQLLIDTDQKQADATAAFWTAQLQDAQSNLASARADLKTFAAANPSAAVDGSSTDSRVVLLLDRIRQWQTKVSEAQDSLSLAQYTSSASARLTEIGTNVVNAPQLATPGILGDRASLKPAAIALAAGLVAVLAYLVILAWADKTVRDPKSIERRMGVPVVATIPRLASSRGV